MTDNLGENDIDKKMGQSYFVRKSSVLSGLSGNLKNIDGPG